MELYLEGQLSPNSGVNQFDVVRMKRALNRLGYYFPFEDIGITGIPDRELFHALKRFQVNNSLPATGTARPDDETVTALNAAIAAAPDGNYIWRAANDDRVRPSHAALDGTVRRWSDSPDPDEDHNCRCWAEPQGLREALADDAIEPVYPELYIIPFMRGGSFVKLAWMAWRNLDRRDTTWTLGKFKKPQKWARQIEEDRAPKRGVGAGSLYWSPADLAGLVMRPRRAA